MLDGYVYAVGGWDGRSRLDSIERYDPNTNTWQGQFFSNLIDWLIAWNFLTFWWWLWIIFVIKVAQEIKTDMHI